MGIELIILKGMFIAAAIGFAVQQIISVNRELKKDAEKAEAHKAESDQGPAPAAARAETPATAPAADTPERVREREPAEVA